jgi:MFS family permease
LQGCTIIYPSNQRGNAVGILFIPILLGVIVDPVIGGILTYYFVFQSILTLIILVIYILIIPETHQYKVIKKIFERNEILEPKLSNLFLSLIYLRHLNIISFVLSASTAFASIIVNQLILAITLQLLRL